jgi:hypothetical protein
MKCEKVWMTEIEIKLFNLHKLFFIRRLQIYYIFIWHSTWWLDIEIIGAMYARRSCWKKEKFLLRFNGLDIVMYLKKLTYRNNLQPLFTYVKFYQASLI